MAGRARDIKECRAAGAVPSDQVRSGSVSITIDVN
jgi:hypothetical protein